MIFFDLIDLQKLRKAVLYLIGIVLAVWLQTMVLSRVNIFGVKPFFLPAVVAAIALWEGGVRGGLLGMFAGAYCDMCCSDTTVLFLVLFTAFGFFIGLMADFLINRSFAAYLMLALAALLLTGMCQIVPLWIFRSTAFGVLFVTVLLQTLWSIPLAVPVYFIVRRLAGGTRRP